MKGPLISVLMVTYNSSLFVEKSIESILNQSYIYWELIIFDDNSTDDTWTKVSFFNDQRIKKFKNSSNLGEYENRNQALLTAEGDWVIFIDADDILYEYGLEVMIGQALKHASCGMLICRPWDERILYPVVISPRQFYLFEYLDTSIIGINFTKVLFKRTAVLKVGSFDQLNIKMGDAFLQYKIGMLYDTIVIQDGFSWWRRRKGQASENLVQNTHLFIIDSYQYLIPLLQDPNNPLTNEQKQIAFYNLYGNYIRLMAKSLLKLKIKTFLILLNANGIPYKYLKSIFIPQRRNYFNSYSGENPLKHSEPYS